LLEGKMGRAPGPNIITVEKEKAKKLEKTRRAQL
jgi:hypothetical protein